MTELVISPQTQAQFLALPKIVQIRIEKVFVRLKQWPAVSGAKPLRGNLVGCYRIRTGDYRVQFRVEVENQPQPAIKRTIIRVEKVGHRDGFYDE